MPQLEDVLDSELFAEVMTFDNHAIFLLSPAFLLLYIMTTSTCLLGIGLGRFSGEFTKGVSWHVEWPSTARGNEANLPSINLSKFLECSNTGLFT